MRSITRIPFVSRTRIVAIILTIGLIQLVAAASDAAINVANPASAPVKPGVPQVVTKPVTAPVVLGSPNAGPQWSELSAEQKLALKPLFASWNGLASPHKRKWLALSKNYADLSPTEQVKLQSRMTEWVALSAQQRAQARVNFAQSKGISSAEKQAKWQQYQALSAEEKRKLASVAPGPAKGAAPAVKPVAGQQVVVAKPARHSATQNRTALSPATIDKNTLLPTAPKVADPNTGDAGGNLPTAAITQTTE